MASDHPDARLKSVVDKAVIARAHAKSTRARAEAAIHRADDLVNHLRDGCKLIKMRDC